MQNLPTAGLVKASYFIRIHSHTNRTNLILVSVWTAGCIVSKATVPLRQQRGGTWCVPPACRCCTAGCLQSTPRTDTWSPSASGRSACGSPGRTTGGWKTVRRGRRAEQSRAEQVRTTDAAQTVSYDVRKAQVQFTSSFFPLWPSVQQPPLDWGPYEVPVQWNIRRHQVDAFRTAASLPLSLAVSFKVCLLRQVRS